MTPNMLLKDYSIIYTHKYNGGMHTYNVRKKSGLSLSFSSYLTLGIITFELVVHLRNSVIHMVSGLNKIVNV